MPRLDRSILTSFRDLPTGADFVFSDHGHNASTWRKISNRRGQPLGLECPGSWRQWQPDAGKIERCTLVRQVYPVRFNHWTHGGPVTLRIAPGETLTHEAGARHEEGYSRTYISWDFNGVALRRNESNESSDCDGRFSSACLMICTVEAVKNNDGYPAWLTTLQSQRDHAAEAAGY